MYKGGFQAHPTTMTAAPETTSPGSALAVVTYWREAGPERWFRKDPAFDADFRARFAAAHVAAASGALGAWADDPVGALALLILLDQFPRNAYRDTARMFATDASARAIAHHAIDRGFDRQTDIALRSFFYLPFMHSEVLAEQERSVELNAVLDDNTQRYAVLHRDIVARFGRFPHRNRMLGRPSTAQEQKFLDEGGFAG